MIPSGEFDPLRVGHLRLTKDPSLLGGLHTIMNNHASLNNDYHH